MWLATVGIAGLAMSGSATPAQAVSAHSAHHFDGTPTVGALYVPGAYPTLHTCTASVTRSTSRNVILTAAHCITGRGHGYLFAPGYHDGKTPYGVWKVIAAYGSPHWIHHHDTQRDWAFLRVANQVKNGKVVHLQDAVGGNRLGTVANAHQAVRVPGYPLGSNDKPINCLTRVYLHHGFPTFNCNGYVGGTSGSPWLAGHGRIRTVVGVIGGLHQGGCRSATSYSSRLGAPARSALERAEHHRHADNFPTPPADGC